MEEDSDETGLRAFIEPFVIILILVLNAAVGVWQESNAESALEALKEMQSDTARVVRGGTLVRWACMHAELGACHFMGRAVPRPAGVVRGSEGQLGAGGACICLLLTSPTQLPPFVSHVRVAALAMAPAHKRSILASSLPALLQISELPARELVPGDIVLVHTGDKVPADVRILQLKTAVLRAEQASLTGESVPVNKFTAPVAKEDCELQVGAEGWGWGEAGGAPTAAVAGSRLVG